MKGLYILSSPLLNKIGGCKLGMSIRLQSRIFDYTTYFGLPYYYACYQFSDDHTINEILFIEKHILDETKQYHHPELGSEFRYMSLIDLDSIVTNILATFKVQYICHKPVTFKLINDCHNKELTKGSITEPQTNRYINVAPHYPIKLDHHQIECIKSIDNALTTNNKCYIENYCGSGKSIIAFTKLIQYNYSIIVVPTLLLIDQFYTNYMNNKTFNNITNKFKILCVCSTNASHCTTNQTQINKFINNNHIIILITYCSFHLLFNNTIKQPDFVVFDEAHNINNNTNTYIKKLKDTKILYMSATIPTNNDFGKLAYKFTFNDALKKNICKDFNVIIDIYNNNDKLNIYKSIAKCALSTGNYKILTYHNTVNNVDSEMSVNNFCLDVDIIKKTFKDVMMSDYPNLKIKQIIVKSITATTKNKLNIVNDFDNSSDDTIYILSSCKSLNEGIDVKNCNCICFCEPKYNPINIIQNLGRVSRNIKRLINAKKSTVILPVCPSTDFGPITDVINSIKNGSNINIFTSGTFKKNIKYDDNINDIIQQHIDDKSNIVYWIYKLSLKQWNEYSKHGAINDNYIMLPIDTFIKRNDVLIIVVDGQMIAMTKCLEKYNSSHKSHKPIFSNKLYNKYIIKTQKMVIFENPVEFAKILDLDGCCYGWSNILDKIVPVTFVDKNVGQFVKYLMDGCGDIDGNYCDKFDGFENDVTNYDTSCNNYCVEYLYKICNGSDGDYIKLLHVLLGDVIKCVKKKPAEYYVYDSDTKLWKSCLEYDIMGILMKNKIIHDFLTTIKADNNYKYMIGYIKKRLLFTHKINKLKSLLCDIKTVFYDGLFVNQLNNDPFKLPVKNGCVDLRTGLLYDRTQNDHFTFELDVEWEGLDYDVTDYDKYFNTIMLGNKKMITYLQTLLGYCMTGLNCEKKNIVFLGNGMNGKTTLLYLLNKLSADYSKKLSPKDMDLLDNIRMGFIDNFNMKYHYNYFVYKNIADNVNGKLITVIDSTNNVDKYGKRFKQHSIIVPFGAKFVKKHKLGSNVANKLDISGVGKILGNKLDQLLVWLVKGSMRYFKDGLCEKN